MPANILASTTLHSPKDGADKLYVPAIVANPNGGFDLTAQSGKRGGTLVLQKTKFVGVDEPTARKEYAKLIASKIKGSSAYRPLDNDVTALAVATERDGQSAGVPVMLLSLVSRTELGERLSDPSWVWQEKKDGERRGIIVAGGEAVGYDRKGNVVPLPSNIVAAALATLPAGTTLDAEIIGDTLHVFDALAIDGTDVSALGFVERHHRLSSIVGASAAPAVVVVPLLTAAQATALIGANVEGIVGKKATAPYRDGRKHGAAVKFKNWNTATVQVHRENDVRSVGVSVYRDGERIDVGNVTIPPNATIPTPGTFVEVRYLYAYPNGSLYQPTFLAQRNDVGAGDASIAQLVYKPAA